MLEVLKAINEGRIAGWDKSKDDIALSLVLGESYDFSEWKVMFSSFEKQQSDAYA